MFLLAVAILVFATGVISKTWVLTTVAGIYLGARFGIWAALFRLGGWETRQRRDRIRNWP